MNYSATHGISFSFGHWPREQVRGGSRASCVSLYSAQARHQHLPWLQRQRPPFMKTNTHIYPSSIKVPPPSAGLRLPWDGGGGVKGDKRSHKPHQNVHFRLFLQCTNLSVLFMTDMHVTERERSHHEFDRLEASVTRLWGPVSRHRADKLPFSGFSKLQQKYLFKIRSKPHLMPPTAGRHLGHPHEAKQNELLEIKLWCQYSFKLYNSLEIQNGTRPLYNFHNFALTPHQSKLK